MAGPLLADREWIQQAFFLNKNAYSNATTKARRTFSTVLFKFTDTTPGGNFAINPLPQFTRTADLPVKGRYTSSTGMGRCYSEAIDDNQQLINMRFGVPQFNSLTTFFAGFYKSGMGMLARTGRGFSIMGLLGKIAGYVVNIITWPISILSLTFCIVRFLAGKPSSKYYYLKPTMPLYWNAVTTMVNIMAVNRGIIPRVWGSPEVTQKVGVSDLNFSPDQYKLYKQMLKGDVFLDTGGVDVYAIANRAQRLARRQMKAMQAAAEANENITLDKLVDSVSRQGVDGPATNRSLPDYIKAWWMSGPGEIIGATDGSSTSSVSDEKRPEPNNSSDSESFWDRLTKFYTAELDDGSAFATFRVDATGPASESFSNTHTQSEIAGSINGMSSQSRSTNFSFAGGNVSDIIGTVIGGLKRFSDSALDTISLGGLVALGGGAFVDIPDHWDNSSASFNRTSYSLKLICPYNNPLSQLIHIDMPLAMLLAAALPMSTGPQSYTSPFLLEMYDKGHCQTRLGMIDSLSITRGTANLPFNSEWKALAVDVNFTIADLSSVVAMPITEGFTLNVADNIFSDDNTFTDYMAVLAGMGLADQIYAFRKLKLNLTSQMAQWKTFFSVSHFANYIGDASYIPPSKLMSAWYRGTGR